MKNLNNNLSHKITPYSILKTYQINYKGNLKNLQRDFKRFC